MYRRLRFILRRRRKPTGMLDLLPTELLLQIASYLALGSLNSLLRTSQRLHILLTPDLHICGLRTPGRPGPFIMRVAVAQGNTALLQRLLVYGNGEGVNKRAPITGITALHSAILLGRREAVTLLLNHGAGVDIGDRKGWNALHWAVLSGSCEMALEILRHGAQSVCGTEGTGSGSTTPLHLAAVRGDTEMVALLVRWGARGQVEDEHRVRAVDYAALTVDGARGGSHDMVRLMGGRGEESITLAPCETVMLQKSMVMIRWWIFLSHEEWLGRSSRTRTT